MSRVLEVRPDLANIPTQLPAGLQQLDQWVLWRDEMRNESHAKVPYQTNGDRASTTDPATWCSFKEACAAYRPERDAGIGFVFSDTDPYCGVDLDECLDPETGQLDPWAAEVVKTLDSYTEVSPSGRGVKIIVSAKKSAERSCTVPAGAADGAEIGIYDRGRYFALTGRRFDGPSSAIEARQAAIDGLCSRLWPVSAGPGTAEPTASRSVLGPVDSDDEALLGKARAAANGQKFTALYDHGELNGHPSPSEADLALCSRLAFWTGGDAARIDRLFRRSALMRPKWDESRGPTTYGWKTINEAIVRTTEHYEHPAVGRSARATPANPLVSTSTGPRPADQLRAHLAQRLEPLYKKDSPLSLFVWDRELRRSYALRKNAVGAHEDFEHHTGELVTELVDSIITGERGDERQRGQKYSLFADALTLLGRDVPNESQVSRLGPGVHIHRGQTAIVNGPTAVWKEDGVWRLGCSPACPAGLVSPNDPTDAEPWLPELGVDLLNADGRLLLSEVIALLRGAYARGWRFVDAWAPDVLALMTVYGILFEYWQRRVYLHVEAASGTGKTILLDEELAFWWPHSFNPGDTTEAALAFRFRTFAAPARLDEFEVTDNHNTMGILANARRASDGEAVKYRGRPDGSVRVFRFTWPMVIASIDPITTGEQDANRFLVVTMPKAPGHDTRKALARYWSEQPLNREELRYELWRASLNSLPLLGGAEAAARELLEEESDIDRRIAEGVVPLLTIAEAARPGSASELFRRLVPSLRQRVLETRAQGPDRELIETLLLNPFRGGNDGQLLSLSQVVDTALRRHRQPVIDPNLGFCIGADPDRPDGPPELWLSWIQLRRSVLAGTRFADKSPEQLTRYLQRCPAYLGSTKASLQGVRARWQRLAIPCLVAEQLAADRDLAAADLNCARVLIADDDCADAEDTATCTGPVRPADVEASGPPAVVDTPSQLLDGDLQPPTEQEPLPEWLRDADTEEPQQARLTGGSDELTGSTVLID